MQQGNYHGDNSGRFAPGSTQNPQYVLSNEDKQNAQGMMTRVLQSSLGVTSQPPPYPGTTPLPSMTRTFSQQMQPRFSPQVAYQGPQQQYQAQQQGYGMGSVPSATNLPSLSPGGISVQQGLSLSPGTTGLPRKSLAGMMSPIGVPQLNLPAQGQQVVLDGRIQGPISPLSVYMSRAQSPQRTPVGHIRNIQPRSYPPPQSPVYPHQSVGYSYGPQQPQVPQTSPVPSPQFVDPSQHHQMSPLLPGQVPVHSPQPVGGPSLQSQRSPYKAARQLNMGASPTKVQSYQAGVGMSQQWQYPSRRTTSQDMWENVPIGPVLPSLPVLSADTLDLLSTPTVSTVTLPVHSSLVPSITETRMQKSPLLQQHLLMPTKPIRPASSTDGNLLLVSGASLAPSTTMISSRQPERSEAPPSRSNLKRSVRQTSSSIEKHSNYSNKPLATLSACCISTNTLTSTIVTSVCKETMEESTTGENNTTPISFAEGLAAASVAENANLIGGIASTQNPAVMDVCMLTTTEAAVDDAVHVSCGTNAAAASLVTQSSHPELLEKRTEVKDDYQDSLQDSFGTYKDCLTELFFLNNQGNVMDYLQFRKRPSNKLFDYLKTMLPDIGHGGKNQRKVSRDSVISNGDAKSPASETSNWSDGKALSDDGKKVRLRSVSHDDNSEKIQKSTTILKNRSRSQETVAQTAPATKSVMSQNRHQSNHVSQKGQSSPLRLKLLSRQNASAPLDESIGSQEEILERAKQEAVVQRKVVELRKHGLWTQRRLPKVQEQPRNKTHWDYLLEEMRWLAADFAQERKWKRAAARKLVRAVATYHKEQHDMARRAKREEQNRLRRIASTMAREIRLFWGNIGKVVEYKQRSLLDEKRQKALDLHLSYIVDQTEKYSDWLTQGLNKPQGSIGSSPSRSLSSSKPGSDDDFLPQGESSDDEETIAVAEEEFEKTENTEEEVCLLRQESELPFEELLRSLPPELVENIGKPLDELKKDGCESVSVKETPEVTETSDMASSNNEQCDVTDDETESSKPIPISLRRSARKRKFESEDLSARDGSDSPKKVKMELGAGSGDDEFDVEREEDLGEDDEATLEEEEKKSDSNRRQEIATLQEEGEMPIEELMKMYGSAFDSDLERDDVVSEESDDEQEPPAKAAKIEQSSSDGEEEEVEEEEEEQEKEEIGMDYLLKADLSKDDDNPAIITPDEFEGSQKKTEDGEGSPSKEITDVAAEAASLQPTGFTLATTQVVTPIPVLLKHTLREYQHIGLDWLVTMYDKRLNGILADEMGLGKTIQTIALLAHLACDKGVWGPHLIVVPTSVMLNWEMEFKKWCPGFKILTYYGSQKERKAKRTGWTKSNAFHVCITSYKLVLQDNVSFRRKKWKYLVLDEAQNIKNFKSQRWQTLLNFNSQRRLLLTGTPLQNNLMELWSLMHFLMPHVFQSHKEFKEWFSNPLTGMIEGGQEYNEKLVKRLHKVLRPFLLRRIKKDVEKQMPNKYEHVIRCHLSKRQRFLYDDFMSQASTKDTLNSGHFMSVINILMQLRKVCNHPNLFEPRPTISPFMSNRLVFHVPSLATKVLDKGPLEILHLQDYHMHLPSLTNINQSHAERVKQLKVSRKLIEELDENGIPVEEKAGIPKLPSALKVKEYLGNLVKDREQQKARNVLNTQQSLQLLQQSQQAGTLPVLTIPMTTGTGALQLTAASTGAAIIPSRLITIPQSMAEDASGGRQSFTLQYQRPQGALVTTPNKQIRQLAGGVVQIMTTVAAAKVQATLTQPVVSIPVLHSHGKVVREKTAGPIADSAKTELMEVDDKHAKETTEKLEIQGPTSYTERLEQELIREHRERCLRMADINERICEATPRWMPCDTIDFLKNIYRRPDEKRWKDGGANMESNAMAEFVKSNRSVCKLMKPVTDRFVFAIPKVETKPIDLHVSHPAPSRRVVDAMRVELLQAKLKKEIAPLHSIDLAMRITFPEARLIQYDCGKLQVLDVLLRRFWTEKHKCLIFTQMTKVLDVLEAFLSYHGYRYLRLDGSTRVEQRMLLMERFNQDPRIFCFILSTRSGGIGVNLTGADTVIFYDSDWNPTMDAQAQDRCHRIGQTRDVHIYRLISEHTVEENILKKANQKRLLGNLAIEGGSFTTAFFKEQALKDLFNEPSGLEDLPSVDEKSGQTERPSPASVLSKPITARQKALADKTGVTSDEVKSPAAESKAGSWEDALQQTEDKEDVDAAKQLKEEQDADMEEFTENAEGEDSVEGSRVHEEMKSLYEELTPIEKYALRYLEVTTEEINREELELAEEEVHRSKQDWEIAHLVALKEEEERRLEEEEDEIFYTREDAENQIYIDDVTGDTMPIWFPLTPPQDENDVYIDPVACLLYHPGPMPDDQLPVVNVKKERKRTKTESDGAGSVSGQKRKVVRTDFRAPRSLFNRPLSQLKKRELKPSKYRAQLKKQTSVLQAERPLPLNLPTMGSPTDKENVAAVLEQLSAAPQAITGAATEVMASDVAGSARNVDWLIHEDAKLLQGVHEVLDMPVSLAVLMPAHTPNWDLVAGIVNSVSSVYRSPKMCKQRFETVIAPREEGKGAAMELVMKKKIKGTKTPTKPKIARPQKTANMHAGDNNMQRTTLYSSRFGVVKETCSKRTAPIKSSGSGPFQRNPKHSGILTDNGITYDKPLSPVQVASQRAERIARDKQVAEAAKQQHQLMQPHASASNVQIGSGQGTRSGLSGIGVGQLTAIPLSGSASNIIVNTSALSAITKKFSQHSGSKTAGNAALQQTLLRTASSGDQTQTIQPSQIQIQQQGQGGTMVTVGLLQRLSSQSITTSGTAAVANNGGTITLSSLTRPSVSVPTGAVIQQGSQKIRKQLTKQQQQRLQQQMQLQLKQQTKPVTAQLATPGQTQKLQITPEAMKKLRLRQQLEANVVTVSKVPSKQRKTTDITQQELEQLLKSQTIRRQIQKPQTAQVQAQQVQEAAAQQAAQHIVTSKPLPITVPVSNLVSVTAVNLRMNMSISNANAAAGTSGQGKSLIMSGQQVPVSIQQQIHIQRQLLKHRMATQQQQQTQSQLQAQQVRPGQVLASKVGGKQTVYAMVAGPSLVAQAGKRRVNVAAASAGQVISTQGQPGAQHPVQLTVTKLLQSQPMVGQAGTQIKQAMAQQNVDVMAHQVRQQQVGSGQLQQMQVASATLVPSTNIAQQHRLITSQRQIRHIQQLATNQQGTQMILTPASSQHFLQQRPNQNVVASISVPSASSSSTATAAQHQMTLSSTQQQQLQNLLTPQVLRAQAGGVATQAAMRVGGSQQQHHLVLSQVGPQQNLALNPQTSAMQQISSPSTPTTLTLAPALVQLPASVVGAQQQPLLTRTAVPDAAQYVARTMSQ